MDLGNGPKSSFIINLGDDEASFENQNAKHFKNNMV